MGTLKAAAARVRAHRSALALVALIAALAVVNLLLTTHAIRANNQQRCSSLTQTADIPLPHPIAGNPSREWEAAFEKIERQRAQRLGCPGTEGAR